jgi:hypothetical protein
MNIRKRREMVIENIKKAANLQLMEDAIAALEWLISAKDVQVDR